LGLGVAVIVGALLVSASGAATTKAQKGATIDVATRASVIHYLRSIHVNAKHAVIQRGLRNYAGANCPGKGWACASTKHTVVQIAKQGGQNRYACKSSKCAVVQISGAAHGVYMAGRHAGAAPTKPTNNSASCVKTGSGNVTAGGQTCTISQTGSGMNTAGIYENSMKVSGLLQSQQYTATITQTSSGTGAAGANTACVTQNVNQDGSASNTNGKATSVSLQAIQSILITQNTLAGNNSAQYGALSTGACDTTNPVTQTQTQSSTVSATGDITQILNPQVSGLTGGNVSLEIEQNQATGVKGSASGLNNATFSQATKQTLIANAKSGKHVSQTENTLDGDGTTTGGAFSGIVGTVNQDSSAKSIASATQNETQCEDAANTTLTAPLTQCSTNDTAAPSGLVLTQTENGPVGISPHAGRVPYYHKGYSLSTQTGAASGVNDSFLVNQTSSQYTDPSGPGITINLSNIMQGDCSSAGGSCTAAQSANLNNTTTQAGWTAPNIPDVHIKCLPNQPCTATPPPAPSFISGPNDPNPSASAAFNFTDTATGGIHFLCKIDGGTLQENVVDPCSSGTAFFQGYGPHTFQVAASDSHGHVSAYVPATAFSWTNVPPDPKITASSEPTNPDFFGTSDTFKFTDAEDPNVNYQCTLDGNTTDCNGGSITYTSADLAPGSHTFSVRAFDSTDTYGSINSDTYTWTILPLEVSALGGDGSSAGWECKPGGPIDLQVGTSQATDPYSTYAQVAITNAGGIGIDGLSAPSFTTDNYYSGSPRFVIDLSNGHQLIGYPGLSGLNGTDMAWSDSAINSGNTYLPWSFVQSFEAGAGTTLVDAYVVADGSQLLGASPTSAPDNISDLTFNGQDYNTGTCP
jgi:hypothetical protein